MRIFWSPCYAHPLPPGHRFPMEKYDLIPEQLIYEGTIKESQISKPAPMPAPDVLLAHAGEYWNKLSFGRLSRQEIRRTGFPWSPELVTREVTIMQGTVDAARYALQHGAALNVSGGTHHAYSDRGEGFCLLNDIALAALKLLKEKAISKALIVDLDVHQGNGTAEILRDVPEIFTFSMHCAQNYPMQKEISDLDIALPAGTGDEAYLKLLREQFPRLIDRVEPDLIFYLSGVDVLATDQLGRLKLSREGCAERDKVVIGLAKRDDIPIAAAMGGGYSSQIRDIVEAHCNTFRRMAEVYG